MANTRRAQAELPRDGWRLDRAVLILADTCPVKLSLEFEDQVITYRYLTYRVAREAPRLTPRVGRRNRYAIYSMHHTAILASLLAATCTRDDRVVIN